MLTSCCCVMVLDILTVLHTTEGCFVHPCALAALFLDRRERGNRCRETVSCSGSSRRGGMSLWTLSSNQPTKCCTGEPPLCGPKHTLRKC